MSEISEKKKKVSEVASFGHSVLTHSLSQDDNKQAKYFDERFNHCYWQIVKSVQDTATFWQSELTERNRDHWKIYVPSRPDHKNTHHNHEERPAISCRGYEYRMANRYAIRVQKSA
jgi:hypothetical protein